MVRASKFFKYNMFEVDRHGEMELDLLVGFHEDE